MLTVPGDGGKRHLAHSTRYLKEVRDMLKAVDMVLEVVDARAPRSSRSEALSSLFGSRGHVVVLQKTDLAEEEITRSWVKSLRAEGFKVCPFHFKDSPQVLLSFLKEYRLSSPKPARFKRPLRLMAAGMPNVGKSTLINLLLSRKVTRTGNRPGITRGRQWVRIHPGMELLDTPGVLPPLLEDDTSYRCLALTGMLPPKRYDPVEAALWLLEHLRRRGKLSVLEARYRIKLEEDPAAERVLEDIGRSRGGLVSGGEVNHTLAAEFLLKDFRGGNLGPLSLEEPQGGAGGV